MESPIEVDFCWLPSAEVVRDWPIGRAFGLRGELIWRWEDGLTHIVLVTDRDDVPPYFEPSDDGVCPENIGILALTSLPNDKRDQVLLWGERGMDGKWRETRIPAPIEYPIKSEDPLVVLRTRRYIVADDPDDGTIDFIRFVD